MCMKSLSVYIHIPFCVQKCVYCDFLSAPANAEKRSQYVAALKKEIELNAEKYADNYGVTTIFFGGGTPSLLSVKDIETILYSLKQKYNFRNGFDNTEITLEMNPGTASLEKLIRLRHIGINRLSIGLQSANDDELKLLGRIHTYEQFAQTYKWARQAGFENINIDLMSALPGQNIDSWINTLNKIVELEPEHISAYSLIIEENTPLYDNLDKYPPLPDEENDRKMYQYTKKYLEQKGYFRYEISNYSKKGYECKHNTAYWIRDNYVGFGLGASSMVDNIRWRNKDNLDKYIELLHFNDIQSIKEDIDELSTNDCIEEYMFLGLRLMDGITVKGFKDCFGVEIDSIYRKQLEKWINEKMLEKNGDRIRLTEAGIDISNVIFADFLLD